MPLVHLALDTGLPVYTSFPWLVWRSLPDRSTLCGETGLACIASYPTLEWGGIGQAAEWFGEPWGWSSHTPHWEDVLRAVELGATIIEKHIRFADSDPEAAWSLSFDGMKEMVNAIKAA